MQRFRSVASLARTMRSAVPPSCLFSAAPVFPSVSASGSALVTVTATPRRPFLFSKPDPAAAPPADKPATGKPGANPNLQSLPQPGEVHSLADLKTDAQVAAERAVARAKKAEMQRKLKPVIDKARTAVEKAKEREAADAAAAEAAEAAAAAAAADPEVAKAQAEAKANEPKAGLFSKVKDAWRARREFVNASASRSAERAMDLSLSQAAVNASIVFPPPPTRLARAHGAPLFVPLWAAEFQTLRTDMEGTFARKMLSSSGGGDNSSGAASASSSTEGTAASAGAAGTEGGLKRATVSMQARPATAAAIAAAAGGAAAAPSASASAAAAGENAGVAAAALPGGVSAADVALVGAMDLHARALSGAQVTLRELVQVPGRVTFIALSASEKGFGPTIGMQRIVAQHFLALAPGNNSNSANSASATANNTEADAAAAVAVAPAVAAGAQGKDRARGSGKKGSPAGTGAGAGPRPVSVTALNLSLAYGHLVKSLLSGSIRSNLERQVPPHLHEWTLPFFEATPEEPLGRARTVLDCRNAGASYFFLLDERGLVRWRCGMDRMFTAEEAGSLLQLMEELVEETRYDEARP